MGAAAGGGVFVRLPFFGAFCGGCFFAWGAQYAMTVVFQSCGV